MERKFKVGDRVKVREDLVVGKKYGDDSFVSQMKKYCGKFGTISKVHESQNKFYIKEFVDFWFTPEMVKNQNEYDKLIFRDNATILIKDGKRYVAKCCKGDTYDREKGLLVCLAKASGYTFDDLQKMLEDAEDQGSKPNNAVKEVERDAKVGEYIKIVNALQNENRHGKGLAYENGDILKVKELRICGNVVTYTKKGKDSNLQYEDCNYIYKREYVVLENYKPNKYKITLSEFFNKKAKYVVNVKTIEEYKKFISACKKIGYFKRWDDTHRCTEKIGRNKNICLGYGFVSCEGWDDKCFYESRGATILKLDDIDLNN